jgi:recombination protein RecA
VEMGIIEKRGSFYSYNDERMAQGRENAKNFLRENQEISDELEKKIRAAAQIIVAPEESESEERQ